jgi:hypothetical protein
MSTKNRPGQFDCYAKLDPDEPFFILRGQDSEAADFVEMWAIRAGSLGCDHDKVLEAHACAEEMRRWPKRKAPD